MVKIVSNEATKLAEALRANAGLKKENAALRLENKILRSSRATPAQATSKAPPVNSPESRKPAHSKTYDRPTRASAARVADTRKRTRPIPKVERVGAPYRGETYVYTDGRPIHVPNCDRCTPGFMEPTLSWRAREISRNLPFQFVVRPTPSTYDGSDSKDGLGSTSSDNTTSPTDTTASTTASDHSNDVVVTSSQAPKLRDEIGLRPLLGDRVDELFPFNIVKICSDTGFKMLQTAHRIAQEAFHDASRKFWPWIWMKVQEGPHVVRLGRMEIADYVGEWGTSVDLALCGTKENSVYYSLLKLVDLRNRICHPEAFCFQNINTIDEHLEHVHLFLLCLGDEERVAQVKSIRDDLCRLATVAFDQADRFRYLAVLPFDEVDVAWELHHTRMFREVLRQYMDEIYEYWSDHNKQKYEAKYAGVMAAAKSWALKHDPWFLNQVGYSGYSATFNVSFADSSVSNLQSSGMVKVIGSLAAQLAAARKRTEYLERKNEALIRENKLLRVSSTRSTPISHPPSLIESLPSTASTHKSCRLGAGYDSPTQASANRVADVCAAKRHTVNFKCKEIHLEDGTYVYTDARLTKIDGPYYQEPHFMKPTTSSNAKKCESSLRSWGNNSSVWNKTASKNTTPSENITPSEDAEKVEHDSTDSSRYSLFNIEKLVGKDVDSLFPGGTAHIASKAGFEILRAAHETAQETLWEASRKFWPEVWSKIKLGPHSVKLGKLEIDAYIGECADKVDLSLCGTPSSTVHYCLLGLIDLRNGLCHPNGNAYQIVNHVDSFLRRVELFTLALRDEERTARARSLRDKLRRLAEEAFDEINCFSLFAALPFVNEADTHWESHHVEIFTLLLHYHTRGWWHQAGGEFEGPCPDQYRGILDVAIAWATTNKPELLRC
ncbi:hypothetical protein GGR53DRAFT_525901 [Hypoxylon sp. FL1150]|nr:hypothetical protein GGR53DRAFT_525901 [Hypoxylon sp. FL1150]